MRTRLRRACRACPFRTDSGPGWLGPWNPRELLASIRHIAFACHRTITQHDQRTDDPALESCAGAAAFLNQRMTLARDPTLARHQRALREAGPQADNEVFTTDDAFIEHHTNGIHALTSKRPRARQESAQSTNTGSR